MTNRITSVENFFSTSLTSDVGASALTFPVASNGNLTNPCFIVLAKEDVAKREVVFCDEAFGVSSFVTSSTANRGLAGSITEGVGVSHLSGTTVSVMPLAQHIVDLNDRISGHAHTGGDDGTVISHASLSGLLDDDHTNLAPRDGSRGFTGTVAGITPAADDDLATKQYVDLHGFEAGDIKMTGAAATPTGWLECDGSAVSRTTYADLFAAVGTSYGTGDGSTTFNVPDLRDRFPVGAGSTYSRGSTGGAASVSLTINEMPGHTHTGPSHTHTGPSHSHTVDPPNTTTTSDSHTHAVDPPSTGTTSDSHSHGAGSYQIVNFADLVNDVSVGGAAERLRLTEPNLDHPVSGTSATDSHSHSVNIASFTSGSDAHTHAVNIAAFSSGNAGTGATGASGTGNTGSTGSGAAHENRPPYLGVRFIIRT